MLHEPIGEECCLVGGSNCETSSCTVVVLCKPRHSIIPQAEIYKVNFIQVSIRETIFGDHTETVSGTLTWNRRKVAVLR